MNGVHDMGGMECFGPIKPDPDEPLFYAEWEKRVLAMTVCMGAAGEWNLDQGRFARESLPPVDYLSIGYYRIWLSALENMLVQRNLISIEELSTGKSTEPAKTLKRILRGEDVEKAMLAGAPVERATEKKAAFREGDSVQVINQHLPTHTRLPGYVKGQIGVIHTVHGCHVFADDNARGAGENPQWLYNVRFEAKDLWGQSRSQARAVHVDCWEPYLIKRAST